MTGYRNIPKLMVTKAAMSKCYRHRFRSFAISVTWFWSMSNNGCWFGDPFPLISTESTIGTLHGQQSAVDCLSSKCGRNFPQNSLVFALLRAFCFWRFCSCLWICRSKLYSMVGFKARLDHSKYIDVSRQWRKVEARHYRDGLGLWLPGAPFGNVWLSLRYRCGCENHAIALRSSPYRFPWFVQHFPPYDLPCKGFCMNLLGPCSHIPLDPRGRGCGGYDVF